MTANTFDAPLIDAVEDVSESPVARRAVQDIVAADWAKGTRPALWLLLGMSGVFLTREFPSARWTDQDVAVALRISHRIVSEALEPGAPGCLQDLAEFWTRSITISAMVRLETRHQFEFSVN